MSQDLRIPHTSLWANRKCLLICCIVSIANLQYGLDSAAVGGLQAMPGFLRSTFQQLIASLLTLGSYISSLTAGTFSHFFVACILQMVSTNTAAIYIGRLVLGFSNGFLASPAYLRGVIVALFAYWASYQVPIGTLFIVPMILAIGLLFVPESPRYLLAKGCVEEARRSLETIRGTSVPLECIELEWAEMVKGIEEEKRLATTVGALDMLKGTDLRRTLLCFGMIACQTGSGVCFVISYGTYFMIVSGLSISDAFRYSIMATCIRFLGVNMGMYLIQLALAIAATVAPGTRVTQNCLIAFTALFKWGYNMCVGAASYPVATELVSTRLWAWTVGSATSLGYLLAWLNAFCTPYFINPENLGWGAKYGYIWAASNSLCVLSFFFCMPEMKGRNLEEIDELFLKKVSVWKFKTYQTSIGHEATREVEEKVLEQKGAMVEMRERDSGECGKQY
ncbi:MFS general substrate transporter [Zopfia rhizophila CBS 207.26]|uniref:MFS general substrate transporter n=1 Tax=Zopfia rhizophila CBS 207.26 TaxID=1314779 RepID=A0A6A6EQX2_9PEZI|nr:MFS general substrate transporter [Zopfia rhizophila CBS 207.26]